MKHSVITLSVIIASIVGATAQDTVRYQDPWYQFNEYGKLYHMWWWNGLSHSNEYTTIAYGYVPLRAQRYTKTGNYGAVYGIAVTINNYPDIQPDRDYDWLPFFKLYRQTTVGGNAQLVVVDTVSRLNTIKQLYFDYEAPDSPHIYYSSVTPCYEFYFNTPVDYSTLSDTFFVSENWDVFDIVYDYREYLGSFNDPTTDTDKVYLYKYNLNLHLALETPDTMRWLIGHTNEQVYGNTVDISQLRGDYYPQDWGGIFPIVNLRCVAPRIWLTNRTDDGSATVRWRATEAGEEYQLAIGEYGSNPDSATLVLPAPDDSTYTFPSLPGGVRHAVWVRKSCRHTTAGYDTVVWSGWSIPTAFFSLGTGEVTDGLDFTISPNPAHGTVQVALPPEATGGHLAFCDLTGRELKTCEVTPGVMVFDIGTLPPGIYLVKLVTPAGLSIRRLVVGS